MRRVVVASLSLAFAAAVAAPALADCPGHVKQQSVQAPTSTTTTSTTTTKPEPRG